MECRPRSAYDATHEVGINNEHLTKWRIKMKNIKALIQIVILASSFAARGQNLEPQKQALDSNKIEKAKAAIAKAIDSKITPEQAARLKNLNQLGGKSGSGGGNVVICFKDRLAAAKVKSQDNAVYDEDLSQIESIEALDLYELTKGRFKGTRKLFIEGNVTSFDEYIQKHLSIMTTKLSRAAELAKELQYPVYGSLVPFTSDDIAYTSEPLKRQKDSGESVDFYTNPKCTLTTIIVQTTNPNELTIDERLFFHPVHSVTSQAVLFIHEFNYAFVLRSGNSTNSLLAQRQTQTQISYKPGVKWKDWFAEKNKFTGFQLPPGIGYKLPGDFKKAFIIDQPTYERTMLPLFKNHNDLIAKWNTTKIDNSLAQANLWEKELSSSFSNIISELNHLATYSKDTDTAIKYLLPIIEAAKNEIAPLADHWRKQVELYHYVNLSLPQFTFYHPNDKLSRIGDYKYLNAMALTEEPIELIK
jgi:hypothetical protein